VALAKCEIVADVELAWIRANVVATGEASVTVPFPVPAVKEEMVALTDAAATETVGCDVNPVPPDVITTDSTRPADKCATALAPNPPDIVTTGGTA
jgi:hypothetical protein